MWLLMGELTFWEAYGKKAIVKSVPTLDPDAESEDV